VQQWGYVRKAGPIVGTTGVATAFPQAAPRMNLLVVDDEPHIRTLCSEVGTQSGMSVTTVATAEEAIDVLAESVIDIVITDLRLRESHGFDLIREINKEHPEVAVIVITGYGSIDSAVSAIRLGAIDYVTKPFRIEELRVRLNQVAQAVELRQENRLLREQLKTTPGFGGLIGLSPKMQSVYKITEKVSQHDYPVLVLGESGTGKELVARNIHFSGPRKDYPFAPVDCSSLVPTLIEAELFGYVRGAFTGALQAKKGLLEAAQGGTVFLDEIGDMPVDLQSKLLRALQEHEIRPVGSTENRNIDVRIVAATHRDLAACILAGTFRQDLYFRLNVVQIKLPALRDRKSDIPLLVASFLEKFSQMHNETRTFSEEAMRSLIAYDWPGNVRELENAVERAVALGTGPILEASDLPTSLSSPRSERSPGRHEVVPLDDLERRAIFHSLRENSGDKVAAARMLGIGKTTLYRKLKRYNTTCQVAEQ
jgi:DNA-binding NtrC family response regulator